jgi:hypothetical protein
VTCENTGTLAGAPGQRPDLVIRDNPVAPVSLETEFVPANTVEADARARLGKVYNPTGGTIEAAVAVRIPSRYRGFAGPQIQSELTGENNLEYCIFFGNSPTANERWPASGYVRGTVEDLAYVVSTARVANATVEEAASILEAGAKKLSAMLQSAAQTSPALASVVAESLKQEATIQTYAMGATILVNAFVFQGMIAGSSDELLNINSPESMGKNPGSPTKAEVLREWDAILKINYWPIFGIAKELMRAVPTAIWTAFSSECLEIADRLLSLNLGRNPDLVGTIFQRLISDRRFLATFYTAPSSAALLARLMVLETPPGGKSWENVDEVTSLKIADFACGTGSLLCALYAEVRARVEHAGGDSQLLHRQMVENALFGCDVIPSATHITASQLSSAFPTVQYKKTNIITMPFGRLTDGGVALGALDLLERQSALSTIATQAGGVGAHSEVELDSWKTLGGSAVSDQSFDLVAMNPPFTRLTGGGGKSDTVSRPLFAAFGTDEADQKAMARRATRLFHGTAYHGNAGAAAAFAEIAHRKLRAGGRLGLILPLSALSGVSWGQVRKLWSEEYSDILVLSIASEEPSASAFSADTGVAECMIVATRSEKPLPIAGKKPPPTPVLSVTLYRRPSSPLEGAEIGRLIGEMAEDSGVRTVEEAPLGGTPLYIGDEKVGEAIRTTVLPGIGQWPVARIRDLALAQVAQQLCQHHKVWLPSHSAPVSSASLFCPLSMLGKPGPYHLDVSGSGSSGGAPRGPFRLIPALDPTTVTFPVLAAHDERRERYLEIPADKEGQLRASTTEKGKALLQNRLNSVWATRTRLHFSTDLRFNANALVACLTTRESVGGRAWPSFILNDRKFEKVVSLWFNSTLGILAFWWIASKSQDGRGSVSTTRLGDLTCIDPSSLSTADLAAADAFFDAFRAKNLMDIHEAALDAHRAELDDFVCRVLLRVPPEELEAARDGVQLLRAKLAIEPSISGGRDGETVTESDEEDVLAEDEET